jgi:hypothetical protein
MTGIVLVGDWMAVIVPTGKSGTMLIQVVVVGA